MRLHQGTVLALSIFLLVPAARAQDPLNARDQSNSTLKREAADREGGPQHMLQIRPLDACTPKSLTPPSTVTGNLSVLSCYDSVINSYEDVYNLNGIAGQTVNIDYSSTAYEVFLWMEGVDKTIVSHISSSGVSRQTISYTLPTTRAYKLEVETLYGPGDSDVHSGPYTLVVTLGSGTPGPSGCIESSTTICLNSRFAVSASWRTHDSSGNGQGLRITSDTGYFTFFSTSNVEVVIKVLNGCGLNSKYWVFAGGLTNVNVTLTIRDTLTGTTWTKTNPIDTAFLPIQDTGAFATCP
jgi:hypothetical protein